MSKCCFLVVILLGSQVASGQGGSRVRSQPADNRPQPELKLSEFRSVGNTPFLVASMSHRESRNASSKFTSSSTVNSAKWGTTANYVFFDTTNDTAVTLLPNNDSLIISLDECREPANPSSASISRKSIEFAAAERASPVHDSPHIIGHVVELVVRDTDGDGEVTAKDRHSLGIADACGRDFAEVIPNLGDIFVKKVLDANTLLVIHGSQAKQGTLILAVVW